MPGRIEFTFNPRQGGARPRPDADAPMRLLILGDFSGRAGAKERSMPPLAQRPLLSLDHQSVDDLMDRVRPMIRLPLAHGASWMECRELDDLHPDTLSRRAQVFESLRILRRRLADTRTFADAVRDLGESGLVDAVSPADGVAPPAAEADADTFERLLGGSRSRGTQSPSEQQAQATVSKLIQDIVEPHLVPAADPQQAEYVAAVDAAMSQQMRAILHDPQFQAVESLWRSLYEFTVEIESEQVQIRLLDLTKAELQAGLAATDALEDTALYGLMNAAAAGEQPWTVGLAAFSFGSTDDDLALLTRLAELGAAFNAPVLAAAELSMLGCTSLEQAQDPAAWALDDAAAARWQALRRHPAAPWLGLAWPRVMVRLPYGADTEPVDTFDFEEFVAGDPASRYYLWGNPAFACARLLVMAFDQRGWDMEPGDCLQLEDTPAYVYREDGESKMAPCAEAWLSERTGEALLQHGLMPWLSFRNRNAAQLLRFQSVAEPLAPLRGVWV